jgi:hypothetical protein
VLFHCRVRVVGSSKFMYDQLLAIDSFLVTILALESDFMEKRPVDLMGDKKNPQNECHTIAALYLVGCRWN